MNKIYNLLMWVILSTLAGICSSIGLFLQGTEYLKNASMTEIYITSFFWASLQWAFAIPGLRLGHSVLDATLLYLAGYVMSFVFQIFSSLFIFKSPVLLDDYLTIPIMIFALYASKTKLFG